MELKVATRQWADEVGLLRQFHFYLTVEPIETDTFCCENYGVRVADEDGTESSVSGITTDASRIGELLNLLVEQQVSPTVLTDVVEDWL